MDDDGRPTQATRRGAGRTAPRRHAIARLSACQLGKGAVSRGLRGCRATPASGRSTLSGMNSYPTETKPHGRRRHHARRQGSLAAVALAVIVAGPHALTVARAVVNLPVSAVAVAWGRAHGGTCDIHDDLIVTCESMDAGFTDAGTTVGNVWLYDDSMGRTGTATRRGTRTSGPCSARRSRCCTAQSTCGPAATPAERVRAVGRPARRRLPAHRRPQRPTRRGPGPRSGPGPLRGCVAAGAGGQWTSE